MTNPKTPKTRLDCLLVERGLAESRQRAQALILAGVVLVGDKPVDKAGFAVREDADIRIRGDENPYVSRGGLKLRGALDTFGLSVQGWIALDVGASTGGFTDCLLQAGASKVYAVDVGYGQFAWKLRENPGVVCIERTNIRHWDGKEITDRIDIVVIDASFISLRLVIPPVLRLLEGEMDSRLRGNDNMKKADVEAVTPAKAGVQEPIKKLDSDFRRNDVGGTFGRSLCVQSDDKEGRNPPPDIATGETIILALVKPQFEVGKGEVGKHGVVRDPALHERVVSEIESFCRELGLDVLGHCESPITGPEGNREFFVYMRKPIGKQEAQPVIPEKSEDVE